MIIGYSNLEAIALLDGSSQVKAVTGEDQGMERERCEDFHLYYWGFPHISAGKESTCNAGDPGSIPGSGRSHGEGIGYPLQYSWASLVAQMVEYLPAMWETWV